MYPTVLLLIFLNSCYGFDECENVNLDDIMAEKWMPVNILDQLEAKVNSTLESSDGSFGKALDTMNFHRSKFNEYQCRNYVASQILDISKNTLQRRVGEDEPKKQNLLLDEGSSSYKEWLEKSATLEDVYRQHQDINNMAVETTKTPISTKHDYYSGHEIPVDFPLYQEKEPHVYIIKQDSEKGYDKKEKLANIFETALTALAFLSFGLFLVHLIMSISAVTQHMTASTIDPRIVAMNLGLNSGSYESGSVGPDYGSHESTHYRSFAEENTKTSDLNNLAKKLLKILDSALKADLDDGVCLKLHLCDIAKHSKLIPGKPKLFLALFCFGMAWLSETLSNNLVTRIESLQALLYGLGTNNCNSIYKKCNLFVNKPLKHCGIFQHVPSNAAYTCKF